MAAMSLSWLPAPSGPTSASNTSFSALGKSEERASTQGTTAEAACAWTLQHIWCLEFSERYSSGHTKFPAQTQVSSYSPESLVLGQILLIYTVQFYKFQARCQKEFPSGPILPIMPKCLLSLLILHSVPQNWTIPFPMPPYFPIKRVTEKSIYDIFILDITFTLVPRNCSKNKQGVLQDWTHAVSHTKLSWNASLSTPQECLSQSATNQVKYCKPLGNLHFLFSNAAESVSFRGTEYQPTATWGWFNSILTIASTCAKASKLQEILWIPVLGAISPGAPTTYCLLVLSASGLLVLLF